MEIRLVALGDATALRAIYNRAVVTSTATFDLRPRSLAAQRAWIERHQGAHPAIVATADGVVTGFGSLSSFRDRPAYSTTVEDSVYVDEAWQRRGIGRALLDELVGLAVRQGFHTVIGRIAGDNNASIELHRACGFALVGVEREVGRKFGRWLDVVIVQRML